MKSRLAALGGALGVFVVASVVTFGIAEGLGFLWMAVAVASDNSHQTTAMMFLLILSVIVVIPGSLIVGVVVAGGAYERWRRPGFVPTRRLEVRDPFSWLVGLVTAVTLYALLLPEPGAPSSPDDWSLLPAVSLFFGSLVTAACLLARRPRVP